MMPMPTFRGNRDERGKLDSKARKCILLGYGRDRKGYRLYDPVQQRFYTAGMFGSMKQRRLKQSLEIVRELKQIAILWLISVILTLALLIIQLNQFLEGQPD